MATIEERAYDYALEEAQVEGFDFGSVKDGYIKGATEQRKIDIDKACDWIKKVYSKEIGCPETFEEAFRRAMEE